MHRFPRCLLIPCFKCDITIRTHRKWWPGLNNDTPGFGVSTCLCWSMVSYALSPNAKHTWRSADRYCFTSTWQPLVNSKPLGLWSMLTRRQQNTMLKCSQAMPFVNNSLKPRAEIFSQNGSVFVAMLIATCCEEVFFSSVDIIYEYTKATAICLMVLLGQTGD